MGARNRPIIFQQGAPKSASSFCAQLLREIAVQNGGDQESVKKLLGLKHKGGFVANLSSYQNKLDQLPELSVIKTHLRPYTAEKLLEDGKAVAFVTFRDPFDSIQSLLDHAEQSRSSDKEEFQYVRTVTDAAKIIAWHLSHSLIWLRNPNVYPVYYSDLKNEPLKMASFMAEKIGVEFDGAPIEKILRHKRKIRRFNVGEEGRGQRLAETPEGREAARMFEIFYNVDKWIRV